MVWRRLEKQVNKILLGDCLEELKKLDDNSVDAIVTDPPYGLSFMGKKWDYDVPSQEIWEECLRVLKPGGYLLSFAGTRTQHRMAVRIEDAGFEIRDMIAWIYGSGFPKSLNIGKAVDKINGESDRELKFVKWFRATGLKQKETNQIIGKSDVGSHYLRLDQPAIPTRELWNILRPHIKIEIPQWVDELVERLEREREIVGIQTNIANKSNDNTGRYNWNTENQTRKDSIDITKGTSEWEGWGTALKPALEPITVARKPLSEKTVALNCLKWGVGGIDIDGSRVGTEQTITERNGNSGGNGAYGRDERKFARVNPPGRFPANLIHDGSVEVLSLFPNSDSNVLCHCGKNGHAINSINCPKHGKDNSSARFFYCAKASKSERNRGCEGLEEKITGHRSNFRCKLCGYQKASGTPCQCENPVWEEIPLKPQSNNHPTVKPVALMEYLVKLVSRGGQIILDPFAGSGSTGIACQNLNRDFILIEREPQYVEIIKARLGCTN